MKTPVKKSKAIKVPTITLCDKQDTLTFKTAVYAFSHGRCDRPKSHKGPHSWQLCTHSKARVVSDS